MRQNRKKSKINQKDLIFYSLMMIWPVAQFLVFYIGVNINSFSLAFQKIDLVNQTTTWTLFDNFKNIFVRVAPTNFWIMAKNSFLGWFVSLIVGVPFGLLFSYYIYKKMPGSGVFRALLFMPSIISSVVLATLFRKFCDAALPDILDDLFGYKLNSLFDPAYGSGRTFSVVIFYNIWIGFGTTTLIYANTMAGIDPEVVESARLDGAVGLREFWYITLPFVYPTMSVFMVTGVANIFINQMNLYVLFDGSGADWSLQTFGYYLYKETNVVGDSLAEYPHLAAFGLLLTFVAIPLTLGARWLLSKCGPSVE